jgi:tRNA-splicing ligase RtcB
MTEGDAAMIATMKLRNWASILDDKTRAQAELTSTVPFVQPWLALMPDAHLGLGATVGSVIPTVGAILPAAVGVDIGCGMIAVRTQFTREDVRPEGLPHLRRAIERAVPSSAGKYNQSILPSAKPRIAELEAILPRDYTETQGRMDWRFQLGTLGSGNHFIEVTLDELGRVWLFLHSGSRGIGNRIANEHIKVAQAQPECADLPDRDLAFLTEGRPEFDAYIADLNWAQHFALLNREEMMDRVMWAASAFFGEDVQDRERINCHHNFTERLTGEDLSSWELVSGYDPFPATRSFSPRAGTPGDHDGVWLSRKGAIDAHAGKPGLIPGSMGTASYVVTGKGNPESFNSSPHGAGRNFSRTQARKTFTLDDLRARMAGIEWRETDAFLDEHPLAYKDIDVVMRDAADLVEIRHTLHQIVNVKGD